MNYLEDPRALIGAVLNQRWRLSRLLGEGGVGIVYEAEGSEGTRAIKLLRPEFCDDEQIVGRFLEEARATARIDHPGVVHVHETGRAEDGTPFLVLDLLNGEPLVQTMNRGRLPVEQAVAVVAGLLEVLAAAHAAGVVHRDLKPDNVYLCADGQGGTTVRVLDFGVARVIDAAGGMARKTRTGMLLGTPGYMSPEQIRNVKTADLRADLWSVGIIFYEMLTGRLAFDGDNDFMRITRVLTSSAVPIEEVAPQYAHWGAFFHSALAPDPDQRFASAAEMLRAARAVATAGVMPGPPVSATAADVSGPFGRSDTAVSAAVAPELIMSQRDVGPVVQVVSAPRRGLALPWVLLVALAALLVGAVLGLVLGLSL